MDPGGLRRAGGRLGPATGLPECPDRRWLADGSFDRPSAEIVAVGVGASLGDHLVRAAGMRWVKVTDEFGTAHAVQHRRGATTAFPIESVRKRIETGETQFIANLAAMISEQIRQTDEPN